MASEVLMVATPEPTSLTDAYATIKVLVGQQQRQTVRVIINQATRPGSGQAITNQLQQVLDRFVVTEPGRPIRLIHMGDIPVDSEVRQAIMRRQLLMQATPGCPAGQAISQLASQLEKTVIPKPV
jgi:flagellar biosynthesis protein FlhG